jgi:uncharacterized protein YjbI with pentapeptide repeats
MPPYLGNSRFINCTFENSIIFFDLSDSDFEDCIFGKSDGTLTIDISSSSLNSSTFKNCDFLGRNGVSGTKLLLDNGSSVTGSTFKECNFRNSRILINLTTSTFEDCDFTNNDYGGLSYDKNEFYRDEDDGFGTITTPTISSTIFDNCDMRNIVFTNGNYNLIFKNGTNMQGSNLTSTTISGTCVYCDMSNCILENTSIDNLTISNIGLFKINIGLSEPLLPSNYSIIKLSQDNNGTIEDSTYKSVIGQGTIHDGDLIDSVAIYYQIGINNTTKEGKTTITAVDQSTNNVYNMKYSKFNNIKFDSCIFGKLPNGLSLQKGTTYRYISGETISSMFYPYYVDLSYSVINQSTINDCDFDGVLMNRTVIQETNFISSLSSSYDSITSITRSDRKFIVNDVSAIVQISESQVTNDLSNLYPIFKGDNNVKLKTTGTKIKFELIAEDNTPSSSLPNTFNQATKLTTSPYIPFAQYVKSVLDDALMSSFYIVLEDEITLEDSALGLNAYLSSSTVNDIKQLNVVLDEGESMPSMSIVFSDLVGVLEDFSIDSDIKKVVIKRKTTGDVETTLMTLDVVYEAFEDPNTIFKYASTSGSTYVITNSLNMYVNSYKGILIQLHENMNYSDITSIDVYMNDNSNDTIAVVYDDKGVEIGASSLISSIGSGLHTYTFSGGIMVNPNGYIIVASTNGENISVDYNESLPITYSTNSINLSIYAILPLLINNGEYEVTGSGTGQISGVEITY